MGSVEIEDAFLFFGLKTTDSEESFKKKFHELALKYHPDKGEFNSDVMFLELMKHKHSIEVFFENRKSHQEAFKVKSSDYALYKEAKQIENDSVLKYFKAREKHNNKTIPNSEFEVQLKLDLNLAKHKYIELIREYPDSLWVIDSKDSISSIEIWLK